MKKTGLLTSSLILVAMMAVAQGQSATSTQGASSQPNSLQGCLSGSADNFTLTDANGAQYRLVGDNSSLASHVGHTVRIFGAGIQNQSTAGSTESGGTTANGVNSLQVSSLEDVAATCNLKNANPVPMQQGDSPYTHLMAMAQQPDMGSASAQQSNNSSSMSSPSNSTSQASQSTNSAGQPPIPNNAEVPATGKTGPHSTEVNTTSSSSTGQTTPPAQQPQSGNQNSAGATSAPPVSSQTPANPQNPTTGAAGTSPANNTGMTPGEANSDAQAARQGELNTNQQTGRTTGRGVNNQGTNNPSQTSPNAVPASPNSTSPQSNANDTNKPLYERQATDLPWSHGTSNNPNKTGNAAQQGSGNNPPQ
jgi:hypothetical protein